MLEVEKRGSNGGGCPRPLRETVGRSARISRVGDTSSSPSVIYARNRAHCELPAALRLPSPEGVAP
jgi:hypothetical protein